MSAGSGTPAVVGGVIELEHAIGYSGHLPSSVHFHPNGVDYVYIAGTSIIICDLNNSHNQIFLKGHDDDISCLTISPSGRMIASGQLGENADIIVWDFETKRLLYRFSEHDHGIQALSFSRDEELLVSIGDDVDGKMIVWDMQTAGMVAFCAHNGADHVEFGLFEKDVKRRNTDKYLLATTGRQQLCVWTLNPYTGELQRNKVSCPVVRDFTCVAFSPDQEWLYAGTETGDFAAVALKSLVFAACPRVTSNGIHSLLPIRDGLVIGGGDGKVVVMSGYGKDFEVDCTTHFTGVVTSLSSTGDEIEILAGTSMGMMYRARIRDLMEFLLLESHGSGIQDLCFFPSSEQRFVSASSDGSVRLWTLEDYTSIFRTNFKDIIPTALACLAEIILVGCSDGIVRGLHADNGELLWELPAHKSAITSVVVAQNEKFFLTACDDGEIRVWLVRSRELLCNFKEHGSAVYQLALFKDDIHAASCSRDRNIYCWDLKRERKITSLTQRSGGIHSMAITADQTQIISVGQDKRITFWDLRRGEPSRVVDLAHKDDILAVALSHGNEFVATGGKDQVVKLWDMEGKLLCEGLGHSSDIVRLRFSPDDRQLLSAGKDSCILVWNVYPSV